MASVYVITNTVNGKRYVGFTSQAIGVRWGKHISKAKKPKLLLHKAIARYGVEVFEVQVLAAGLSTPFALALETAAITSLGTLAPGGYNLTSGGEGALPSDETRAKIGAKSRGRRLSPEARAKIGAVHKGSKHTQEHKEKISASQKGRPKTEAAKRTAAATRRARLGHLVPEALALLSAGVPHSKVAEMLGIGQTTVGRWLKESEGRG